MSQEESDFITSDSHDSEPDGTQEHPYQVSSEDTAETTPYNSESDSYSELKLEEEDHNEAEEEVSEASSTDDDTTEEDKKEEEENSE